MAPEAFLKDKWMRYMFYTLYVKIPLNLHKTPKPPEQVI